MNRPMNRTEWLYLATLDMPRGVKERFRAETLAHLDEAGALQDADVREILGSPEAVHQQLTQTYLTQKRWSQFENLSGVQAQLKFPFILLFVLLGIKLSAVGFDSLALQKMGMSGALWPHYLGLVTGLSVYGLLWLVANKRPKQVKWYLWRELALLPLWIAMALGAVIGFDPLISTLLTAWVAWRVIHTWQEISKFERTMQVEGQA